MGTNAKQMIDELMIGVMRELSNPARSDMQGRANAFLVDNQAARAHIDGLFNALVGAMLNENNPSSDVEGYFWFLHVMIVRRMASLLHINPLALGIVECTQNKLTPEKWRKIKVAIYAWEGKIAATVWNQIVLLLG